MITFPEWIEERAKLAPSARRQVATVHRRIHEPEFLSVEWVQEILPDISFARALFLFALLTLWVEEQDESSSSV